MNETETMCERCCEVPADTLVEHVMYAEAICYGCRKDEEDNGQDEDCTEAP